jgi:hypothetical protein
MERALQINTWYSNITIKVDTPDGSMFVTIIEDSKQHPIAVEIVVGKAGSPLRAWTQSAARLMTLALTRGAAIEQLIEDLSLQTSDRSRRHTNGVEIKSGPEGVAYALMQYRSGKYIALDTDEDDDDDGERKGRFVRMAR